MTNPQIEDQSEFQFPEWTNKLPLIVLGGLVSTVGVIVFVFWYWFSPKNLEVGYEPKQPIPYSHKLHAGDLGIDCRYCHVNVEKSAKASIPSTEICMNCHTKVKTESPEIMKLRKAHAEGKPIEWVRVYKLPDYAYFDHSRHVNAGVGCATCHGRVDKMEIVRQETPMSMSWCLECHRNPAPNLREVKDVTNMDWEPSDPELGKRLMEIHKIHPREDCSACHR